MKICFIGFCGHSFDAYKALKRVNNTVICGYANGSEHEKRSTSPLEGVTYYDNYKKMLDTENPDIAVVSPVFGLTGEICIECANRGIDIFAEKPVAKDIETLNRLKEAVVVNNVRFLAMHYLRYNPAFYTAAGLVRKGAIGDITLLNAQKSYKYGTRPGWYESKELYTGTIPWVGIHGIDWIYHFSGKKFLSVRASSDKGMPEKSAACLYELEGGAIATLSVDYYRPGGARTHGDDRIRCVGTKGVLEVKDGRVLLIDSEGERYIENEKAPDLFEEFLLGKDTIGREEVFYLTEIALLTRESADLNQRIEIGGAV
jgi:predicted dehydrogenase